MTSFSSYLRRLQEAAAAAAVNQPESQNEPESATSPVSSVASPPKSAISPSLGSKSPPGYLEPSLNPLPPASVPLPPSRYPIAADSYHPLYPQGQVAPPYPSLRSSEPATTNGNTLLGSHTAPKTEEPHSFSSQPDHYNNYSLYNWSYKQHQPSQISPPTAIPALSYYYRPRRLEEIAPRDTISLIIALFFDFVYPLTPCIHKPSFMADLHARREERDPLFFALVMSTVASTLVQVPRSYLPMERPVVRKLAQVRLVLQGRVHISRSYDQTCYEASRHISVASYDPPTSMHVVIRYLWV